MNFSLSTVSLLSHLQILHLTFNAIVPDSPASSSQGLSQAYSCQDGINLLIPAPHSQAHGAPGVDMCGAAAFGGFFSSAAGRQAGERK